MKNYIFQEYSWKYLVFRTTTASLHLGKLRTQLLPEYENECKYISLSYIFRSHAFNFVARRRKQKVSLVRLGELSIVTHTGQLSS